MCIRDRYRAVTWLIISNSIDPNDQAKIKNILKDSKLEFKNSGFVEQKIFINNIDVPEKIRSPKVTSMVSEIAKQQFVRELLTRKQKVIGNNGGLVAEGRDIGTAVFPDAELNFSYCISDRKSKKKSP